MCAELANLNHCTVTFLSLKMCAELANLNHCTVTFLSLKMCAELANLNHCTVTFLSLKMCAELANLNHCTATFLSLAAVNLCWYNSTVYLQVLNLLILCTLYIESEGLTLVNTSQW